MGEHNLCWSRSGREGEWNLVGEEWHATVKYAKPILTYYHRLKHDPEPILGRMAQYIPTIVTYDHWRWDGRERDTEREAMAACVAELKRKGMMDKSVVDIVMHVEAEAKQPACEFDES